MRGCLRRCDAIAKTTKYYAAGNPAFVIAASVITLANYYRGIKGRLYRLCAAKCKERKFLKKLQKTKDISKRNSYMTKIKKQQIKAKTLEREIEAKLSVIKSKDPKKYSKYKRLLDIAKR